MSTIITKPKTLISEEIIDELELFAAEQGQVIVHGLIKSNTEPFLIRIWPSTYLFDQNSNHISELVHFEKISGFPLWTEVPVNKDFSFTLIFSGLIKSCNIFDLQEVIPQSNGFFVPSIVRNKVDIYYLDFSR